MTDLTPTTTLAEIVNLVAGSERTLESFGLDYCCGGARTLEDACRGIGVAPSLVLDRLARLESRPAPTWLAGGPAALADHLEATHHASLRSELPRLAALIDKVATVHGGNHPELAEARRLFGALRSELEDHLVDEERVAFPLIRRLASTPTAPGRSLPSLPDAIAALSEDHESTGRRLAALRAATDDYRVPPDGCASYRALYQGLADLEADLHLHVHKENNVLFPAALALGRRSSPALDPSTEGR